MPTSKHRKHRSHKPSQMPAKTINIAPKTAQSATIYLHITHPSPTQMNGNEQK